MEPVTYFAYLSTVIIGYTYYALIRDDYTYANLHELLTRSSFRSRPAVA
jgi:hypothetical protein